MFVLNFNSVTPFFPSCHLNRPTHHQFPSVKSLLKLKNQSFLSNSQFKLSRTYKPRSRFVVFAAQSNITKVLQNAWRVGKDGIDAGTNLVPSSVPRPIARIAVTFVGLSALLFVFKSILSTVFFILATIGLAYFAYLAFNKDQGPPSGNGGTTTKPMNDPVEEAQKIMDKYK
ncbi:uncharacterized protein LOC131611771 [Vicia villosa]|uniref:uncharacterized protein LOC131611757 n=1 Tax=Vicia villosa TaxID=3911 RepID=UPI00273C644C|nr:uncharacterized protein LOC131611757 [Vicia villosa]XP_058739641.1 uncharacterized protein LOC131611771 [Vicia villosa]